MISQLLWIKWCSSVMPTPLSVTRSHCWPVSSSVPQSSVTRSSSSRPSGSRTQPGRRQSPSTGSRDSPFCFIFSRSSRGSRAFCNRSADAEAGVAVKRLAHQQLLDLVLVQAELQVVVDVFRLVGQRVAGRADVEAGLSGQVPATGSARLAKFVVRHATLLVVNDGPFRSNPKRKRGKTLASSLTLRVISYLSLFALELRSRKLAQFLDCFRRISSGCCHVRPTSFHDSDRPFPSVAECTTL